ncbi:MAG: hypothetical protein GX576_08880 [Thauera phenolivorans]|uniref:Uncharacterized protein n=1 Tax=Thauera phenolivorans TaxID=1792543 RepID=A0A7X7R7T5_9RHOO|nr:hypothetical protein [Thauera phenolivorans]NLF54490.1 hypothetical protein [Thauera phenolivorans]
MNNPIYDTLSPQDALELEQVARLIYESRENRRRVLAAAGAEDEQALLSRITDGSVDEHPAYEHYLAARILADTHEAARTMVGARLAEVNRR